MTGRPTNTFLALFLVALAGCAGTPLKPVAPTKPNVVSLASQNWYINWSSGMPDHPSFDPGGAWFFRFPSAESGGHVNYVQTPFSIDGTITLHDVFITFRVDSLAPQYDVLDTADRLPATVHLFFEQKNDDMVSANGRWWADISGGYDLGSEDNSTISLIVPFTPDQWSNVYGEHNADAFYAALNNVGWIGITFGGDFFWGHGVALSGGTAQYHLLDFHVE